MSYDLAGFISSIFCVKDSDSFAYDMAPLSTVF